MMYSWDGFKQQCEIMKNFYWITCQLLTKSKNIKNIFNISIFYEPIFVIYIDDFGYINIFIITKYRLLKTEKSELVNKINILLGVFGSAPLL